MEFIAELGQLSIRSRGTLLSERLLAEYHYMIMLKKM